MEANSLNSILQEFNDNPFTKTPGYGHYLNPNTNSVERQKSVSEFLNDPTNPNHISYDM